MNDQKQPASQQGQNETVEITIIRSADGKVCKISLPLSNTLNTLKDVIHSHPILGPAQRNHQRLFHLGRELKSGNRSLKALGIGKHEVFSIHLHSLAPKTFDLQSDEEEEGSGGKEVGDSKKEAKSQKHNHEGGSGEANNNDNYNSDGDDEVIEIDDATTNNPNNGTRQTSINSVGALRNPHQRQQSQRQEQGEKVVELLDSDSDDDEIEVVETVPSSRKRRKVH